MINYKEQEDVLLCVINLKDLIIGLRRELPNILQPLNLIQEHLNQLFDIEGDYSLDLDIDEKEILIRGVVGLMEESKKWTEIVEGFDSLIEDIENWKDSLDEDDECTIDLVFSYLDDIENIQEKLDTTEIDFDEYNNHIDAIDDMLADVLNALEEFTI